MSDSELSLGGKYSVCRSDRPGTVHGGGVCVLIDQSTSFVVAKRLSTADFDIACIDLFSNSPNHFRLCCCYLPPRSSSCATTTAQFLCELGNMISATAAPVLLCGDFNFPSVPWQCLQPCDSGSAVSLFINFVSRTPCLNLLMQPLALSTTTSWILS